MPPNTQTPAPKRMLQPTVLKKHPIRSVMFVLLLLVAIGLVLKLTIGSKQENIVPAGLDAKLERYYVDHGSYPYSLAELPGLSITDTHKGTSLVYRTTSKDGKEYDSYNGSRVTAPAGTIMCGYAYYSETSGSVDLNPQIQSRQSVSHC